MGRKKQGVAVEEIHGIVDVELHGVVNAELHEVTDREERSVDVQKNKQGPTSITMVPINIKSWPSVPENIKQKLWEEISNAFELAPQSESAVMNSASQKWRDFKNKLTSRFVWPNKCNPEKLSSPPSQYQIPKVVWKAFVDERLHPSWEKE
ncbi:hypothetical protein ZIOFF_029892 [Zingiber officinale]|uniref:Uncharacterized protein n=1 Tax=Zingiber officinale TaxID=94328 RepID=A0A8J5LB81_ZINOF|nr:hypothetical protein ZIOFF_029892 [Zingiber officinale]